MWGRCVNTVGDATEVFLATCCCSSFITPFILDKTTTTTSFTTPPSLSSSLHCPLIVTSLALQYQARCSGPAATLNSGCRGLKRRVVCCARRVRDSRRSRAENWRAPSHQLLPSPISLSLSLSLHYTGRRSRASGRKAFRAPRPARRTSRPLFRLMPPMLSTNTDVLTYAPRNENCFLF